jgi:hypothetical protein
LPVTFRSRPQRAVSTPESGEPPARTPGLTELIAQALTPPSAPAAPSPDPPEPLDEGAAITLFLDADTLAPQESARLLRALPGLVDTFGVPHLVALLERIAREGDGQPMVTLVLGSTPPELRGRLLAALPGTVREAHDAYIEAQIGAIDESGVAELVLVAPFIAERQWPGVIERVSAIEVPAERARALAVLAPRAPGEFIRAALAAVRDAVSDGFAAWLPVLAAIVEGPAEGRLDAALHGLLSFNTEAERLLAWTLLAPLAPEALLRDIDTLERGSARRAAALVILAPHLEGARRTTALKSALALVVSRESSDGSFQDLEEDRLISAGVGLLFQLPEVRMAVGLVAVLQRTSWDDPDAAGALTAALPCLARSLAPAMLLVELERDRSGAAPLIDAIRSDPGARAAILTSLGADVCAEVADRLMLDAPSIRDLGKRLAIENLAIALDPRAGEPIDPAVILDLFLGSMIDDAKVSPRAAARILRTLPSFAEGLGIPQIAAIAAELPVTQEAAALLGALPEEMLEPSLGAVSKELRGEVDALAVAALEAIGARDQSTLERGAALLREPAWAGAIEQVMEIDDATARARLLAVLAAHAPRDHLRSALAMEQAKGSTVDEAWRTVLTAVADGPESGRLGVAMGQLPSLGEPQDRVRACALLAPLGPTAVLSYLRSVPAGGQASIAALAALVPHLEGADRATVTEELLALLFSMKPEDVPLHTVNAFFRLPEIRTTMSLLWLVELTAWDGPGAAETFMAAAAYLPRMVAPTLLFAHLMGAAAKIEESERGRAIAGLVDQASDEVLRAHLDGVTGGLLTTQALLALARPGEGDRAWLVTAVSLSKDALSAHIAGAIPDGRVGAAFTMLAERPGDREARLLLALAPRATVATAPLLVRALHAMRGEVRVEDLAALLPRAHPELRSQLWVRWLEAAFEEAGACRTDESATRLAGCLVSASTSPSAPSWGRLVEVARAVTPLTQRVTVLLDILPSVPPALVLGLVREIQELSLEIADRRARLAAVLRLARQAPEIERRALLETALRATQTIADDEDRTAALVALAARAAHADPLTMARALEGVWRILDCERRARLLSPLIPHLPEPAQPGALRDALAATAIGAWLAQAEILGDLAARLPEACWPAMSEALRAVPYERDRARAVVAVAALLPAPARDDARALVREMRSEIHRATALLALAPHLPPEVLHEEILAADQLGDPGARARLLVGLLPHVSAADRPQVADRAIAAMRRVDAYPGREHDLVTLAALVSTEALPALLEVVPPEGMPRDRAAVLTALADRPDAPDRGALLRDALEATRAIVMLDQRARAVAKLAPHLPDAVAREAVDAVFAVARASWSSWTRVTVVAALGQHLPREILREELQTARAIRDRGTRLRALELLGPVLPEQLLRDLVRSIRATASEELQSDELLALAPSLPDALLAEVLAAARMLGDSRQQARLVSALAPAQSRLPRADLYDLWSHTLRVLASGTRPGFLSSLAVFTPLLVQLGGPEDAAEAARAIVEVGAWWSTDAST